MSRPAASRFRVLAAVLVLGAGIGVAEAAEGARGLAAHRAVYEMGFLRRADRSEVTQASGRLVYEFSGTVCDGFSSRFRLVLRMTNTDGTGRVTDMRTTSFEDGDGRSFDFVNQNLVDSRSVEDTKGVARREAAGTRVAISSPQSKTLDIPAGARFPTEHMVALLDAAKAGKTVAEIDLFDGSEGGSRIFRTTVVIGREQTGPDDTSAEPVAAKAPELTAGLRRWPVDISYFDPSKSETDSTPEYQLGFVLYENGVSRRLRLDYGDFALSGTLSTLEALPKGECK